MIISNKNHLMCICRFFRSVTSKPRPSDHPLLIIFVVGGVTATEAKQIKDVVLSHQPNTEVSTVH